MVKDPIGASGGSSGGASKPLPLTHAQRQRYAKGAHYAHNAKSTADTATPQDEKTQVADAPVADDSQAPGSEGPHKNPRLPLAAKVALGIVGGLVAIYLIGVVVFSNIFMPGTTLLGRDVSWKSGREVAQNLGADTQSYTLAITGDGVDKTIAGPEVDISFDSSEYVASALSEMNPWSWPAGVFTTHAVDDARGASFDEAKVSALVKTMVDEVNAHGTDPQNATIAFDDGSKSFQVVAEVAGTKLDESKVLQAVKTALQEFQPTLTLDGSELLLPALTKDSAELAQAAEKANGFLKANFTIALDGKEAGTIDAARIKDWVILDENLDSTLNTDAIIDWGKGELSSQLDTVGTERTYTRADGKQVTVSGGTYGWNVNSDELADQIVQWVKEGKTGTLEIPTRQTAAQLPDQGGRDWGSRYIDIDLAEQHVRMYDDGGNLIWETDCVSGNSAQGYDTPMGVYVINDYFNKSNPGSTLIGKQDPETGKPEYETPVAYWMPFVGNSVGLHDANWRARFGGNIYLTNGSHGCVNLPVDKAAELAKLINVGDVVVVHG